MRATGIVRRIDELGRIVIPKEIRRTMRIRESDPLEIFTDREGSIILKPYSPVAELSTQAQEIVQAINGATGMTAFVCDRERMVACAGQLKRTLADKPLTRPFQAAILAKQSLKTQNQPINIELVRDQEHSFPCQDMFPIIVNGEAIGAVGLVSGDPAARIDEAERLVLKTLSLCISKQFQD
ncbi:MAG: stage V sporulation T C-terminal domain-containing protein [Clostridia bacterium]|nr:stage V sporulation T C-terminal domain-containing protein [Clostridia bacterium]